MATRRVSGAQEEEKEKEKEEEDNTDRLEENRKRLLRLLRQAGTDTTADGGNEVVANEDSTEHPLPMQLPALLAVEEIPTEQEPNRTTQVTKVVGVVCS